jgi:uncharacterized protein (TIGR02594 family)
MPYDPTTRVQLLEMLRGRIDGKPWHVIVLAAFFGAIGSEAVKGIPSSIAYLYSFFPIDASINIFVTSKLSRAPLSGVDVSVIKQETNVPLEMADVRASMVATKEGVAILRYNIKPGMGYLMSLSYTFNGKQYAVTRPIEINGTQQESFDFDPNEWSIVSNVSSISTSDQPLPDASATASLVSGALPKWMQIAFNEIGQKSGAGAAVNQRIVEYLSLTGQDPSFEKTFWNSAFVNWVMNGASYAGTKSAVARSWLSWGIAVKPVPGCIAVLWTISPNSEAGHVAFYLGESTDTITYLGGGQRDPADGRTGVFIRTSSKSRFLGCRMPG